MRATLPGEIKQARSIVQERQDIPATAKREAERIAEQAPERQAQLASRHELIREAERTAEEILGRHLPQPQRLDQRILPQLFADPVSERIELRRRRRARVPRRRSELSARRTVFRCRSVRRLISRIDSRSTRCIRLISAHRSTPTTHSLRARSPDQARVRTRLDNTGPTSCGSLSTGAAGSVFRRRPKWLISCPLWTTSESAWTSRLTPAPVGDAGADDARFRTAARRRLRTSRARRRRQSHPCKRSTPCGGAAVTQPMPQRLRPNAKYASGPTRFRNDTAVHIALVPRNCSEGRLHRSARAPTRRPSCTAPDPTTAARCRRDRSLHRFFDRRAMGPLYGPSRRPPSAADRGTRQMRRMRKRRATQAVARLGWTSRRSHAGTAGTPASAANARVSERRSIDDAAHGRRRSALLDPEEHLPLHHEVRPPSAPHTTRRRRHAARATRDQAGPPHRRAPARRSPALEPECAIRLEHSHPQSARRMQADRFAHRSQVRSGRALTTRHPVPGCYSSGSPSAARRAESSNA